MRDRYPGYDVLAKRNTPSWNEQTRARDRPAARDRPRRARFFTEAEWQTLRALCDRIVPQPADANSRFRSPRWSTERCINDVRDGYRDAELPPMHEAWRAALAALDAEARGAHGRAFHELARRPSRMTCSRAMQHGDA